MPRSLSARAQTRLPLADKPDVQAQAGKYLTFRVARVEFAVQATRLRGILPATDLQPVAPSFRFPAVFGNWTCGFASIRGRDIPVVDLRGQLNLPHGTHGRHPCIIVVDIPTLEGPRQVGFIADRVANIIHARDRDFVRGRLRFGERSLRVLDPKVLVAISPEPAVTEPAELSL
jgi:chemotaxis signal transduction protein